MYTDYPTIYETTINENLIYYIILLSVLLIILIIILISLVKIYKKANRSGLSAIIPFYNLFVLLEIVNLPKWYFILMLIPGINLIFYVIIMLSLANLFRKSKLFGLGLAFLPFIFYPILAFSKSEYIGINIAAIGGKTIVEEERKITTEDQPIINEEVDEKSRNINISIGGGVYQKDYTKDLLKVDDDKTVQNINPISNEVEEKNNEILVQPSFIAPIIEEEPTKEEVKKDISTDFQSQMYEIKPISEMIVEEKEKTNIDSNNSDNNQSNIKQPLNTYNDNNINSDKNMESGNEFTYCPKCGTKIKSGTSVCFLCGSSLK